MVSSHLTAPRIDSGSDLAMFSQEYMALTAATFQFRSNVRASRMVYDFAERTPDCSRPCIGLALGQATTLAPQKLGPPIQRYMYI